MTGPETADSHAARAAARNTLIQDFMNRYPEEDVDAEVRLFATKSGNPAIAALVAGLPTPHTRAHLRAVLEIATLDEIAHVGW